VRSSVTNKAGENPARDLFLVKNMGDMADEALDRLLDVDEIQQRKDVPGWGVFGGPKREVYRSSSCHACGAILVKRTGKYGQFWGCSNFPECKTGQTYSVDSAVNFVPGVEASDEQEDD
jgi:hypothetical protein